MKTVFIPSFFGVISVSTFRNLLLSLAVASVLPPAVFAQPLPPAQAEPGPSAAAPTDSTTHANSDPISSTAPVPPVPANSDPTNSTAPVPPVPANSDPTNSTAPAPPVPANSDPTSSTAPVPLPSGAATPDHQVRPAAPVNQVPRTNRSTGILRGTVTGEDDGKPLSNVVVLIRRAGDAKGTEVISDKDGAFEAPGLKPGEYSIKFSTPGMLAKSQTVNLQPGDERVLKVSLESAEAADVLRVTKKRTLVRPDTITETTHIDRKYLEQLGSGNNLRRVIETAPGIQPDSLGNIITRGEHNAVNYVIDGAVLPEAAGVLQQGQFASPRSLQSIDVDIGGYQARDGGGPMGAVVRMRSLPLRTKPTFECGTQLGGPMSGGFNYYGSTALSQDPNSILNKIRVESSGTIFASKLGLHPPVRHFRRDAKFDLNILNKVEYQASENDRFTLTAAINETYLHQPTSIQSRNAGVKINEHDRQNFVMLSYKHRFHKFFDEANLHLINAFYSQHVWQPNVFDPNPIINGDSLLQSAAVRAQRYNYAFSAQGDISKTLLRSHHLLAGFLSEIRPVKTNLSEFTYDANPVSPTFGVLVSPFTGMPGGPQFQGNMGKYHGFRYVQSGYLQDTWHPETGRWSRLTLNAGLRADVYHGVFGNSMGIAETIAAIPGSSPFNAAPFQKQTVTNAQLSGRYGGAISLTKTMVAKASFSNLFIPPPVDVFLTPFSIVSGPSPFNGIFNGAPRPLQATRGRLVDVSLEKQVGPRFVIRNNLFYKKLYNFGDSGVINNSVVYNRLELSGQEAYGVESRFELKARRDGTGFYGFLSNTMAVAYLRGSRKNSGGTWDVTTDPVTTKYPDHDRRNALQASLGYRTKSNFWILASVSAYSGLKDDRDPLVFGPHPARTKPICLIGLNAGFDLPKTWRSSNKLLPNGVEVRIENLTNSVVPINLGSPYQGTRYSLPIRVLSGMYWRV